MENEELCTPQEIASRLKVPTSWVYRRTRERTIPFLKAGRYCRFRWSEVEKWSRDQANRK
jgi:excisionase family DNA binding protein